MIEIIGTEFYQWDTGRSLKVTDSSASHIHFANPGDLQAVKMELSDSTVKIPDYLFQSGKQLCVYLVNNGATVEKKVFPVRKRERPEDYVYDEDQRNFIYELIHAAEEATDAAGEIAKELQAARENGEFNGPPGESATDDQIKAAVEAYMEENPGGNGEPGQDGISPVITVSDITGGHRITITDINGKKTVDVMDGKDGPKGDTGATGPQGPKGDTGAQGPQGEKGDTGPSGPTGPAGADGKDGTNGKDGVSPTVTVSKSGKITTVKITDASGTKTATINDGNDGQPGSDGQDGNGIKSAVLNADYTLTLTFDDGTSYTTPSIRGATGAAGKDGADGSPGKDGAAGSPGADGKTAYQYAKDGGYAGTEAEFSTKLAKEYPSKVSELTNDSNFITAAGAPVQSVNNKKGAVSLSASDVGARPSSWMPTYSDVGAEKSGTAASAVSTHNTKTDAHNDIRLLITALTSRLDALANSDDETLDQMAEVVAYIKSNRDLIDQITTGKVSVTDIVNNLTTNVTNKPLSAAQGVALKALIDAITIPTKLSQLTNDKGYITGYTETDPTVPAWAKTASKPSYSKSEVGLGNVDNVKQYSANNPPPYPVTKVNGKTGDVTLDADAVGARPSSWMPTAANVGAVPTSRTVNGKALSTNISLSASDVGAVPNTKYLTLVGVDASGVQHTYTIYGEVDANAPV